MKKLVYTFIALFITAGAFAQDKSASLDKLLKAKNGEAVFTSIIEHTIDNIDQSKQADFKKEIAVHAAKAIADAKAYFMKKYSKEELDAIYAEYTDESKIDMSDKVNSFARAWRSYRAKFQKEFKETYIKYQQM